MRAILSLPPKRRQRHWQLALIAAGCVLLFYLIFGLSTEMWLDHSYGTKSASFEWRVSMALGYTAVIFLGITLAIGPVNALRHRPTPPHSYLRRDIGIWAGLLALVHVVFGASIHIENFQVWTLFLKDTGSGWVLQDGWFGLAYYVGLLQVAILLLLLGISNDVMMRRLGMSRWKNLQRLLYVVMPLLFVHGFAMHRAENRERVVRLVFMGMMLSILLIQFIGFMATRRKQQRISQQPADAGSQQA